MPEIALAVNCLRPGNAQIENVRRHGHREDTVAQSGQTFGTLTCNAVVEGRHRMGV
jgi:hypothetical protein